MKTLYISIISVMLSIGTSYADDKTLQEQFNRLDTNADGVLSRQEVKSQSAIVRFMNLFSKDSYRMADVNKDGVVDRKEFIANEEIIPAE